MEHEDMEKMQAERLMYEISLKIHKMPKTEDRIDKRDLHIAPVPCPKLEHLPPLKSFNDLSYVGEKVYQYLLNRGITDKHIKKYYQLRKIRYFFIRFCTRLMSLLSICFFDFE